VAHRTAEQRIFNSPRCIHPTLLSILAVDTLHVTICFSEVIPDVLASDAANYSISNGIGQPVTAMPSAGGCVELLLALPLSPGITYTLTIFKPC
jgi:hypothetical protein